MISIQPRNVTLRISLGNRFQTSRAPDALLHGWARCRRQEPRGVFGIGTIRNLVLGGVILRQKETLSGPRQRTCYLRGAERFNDYEMGRFAN